MVSRSIMIFGPTASGKSSLAMALAERTGSTIANADSMQVYRDLHILSARPSEEDTRRMPHALYGHLDGAVRCSVARYVADFSGWLKDPMNADRRLIIVGGTGMYIEALRKGLSPIPDIPAHETTALRARLDEAGSEALWEDLHACDPAYAQRLERGDSQRILRGLEVVRATGRSLLEWQKLDRSQPLLPDIPMLALLPDRALSRRKIADRLDVMLEEGALEEVERLMSRRLDPTLPVMKAHGVPEFSAHLRGEASLRQAQDRVAILIGQYAKRQSTWLRNRAPDCLQIHGFGSEPRVLDAAMTYLDRSL